MCGDLILFYHFDEEFASDQCLENMLSRWKDEVKKLCLCVCFVTTFGNVEIGNTEQFPGHSQL